MLVQFNYHIADFVSRLNLGLIRKLRFIKIDNTPIATRLLHLLYKQGVIRTYQITKNGQILVYYKYWRSQPICKKLILISKPSKRIYNNLTKLSKNYNNNNFSGFYIISSPKGLVTSEYCLLNGRMGGEILIKVEI